MKKVLLFLLVAHGFFINLIGVPIAYILLQPADKLFWLLAWLSSFQVNVCCIFFYKKRYPEMRDPARDQQRSPWLGDIFYIEQQRND